MPGQSRKPKYGIGKATAQIELELPSGNTCLVIRPGVQGLIKYGILDSLDSLTGLVQTELIDPHDPKKMQAAVARMAERPEDLTTAMDLVDKVIAYVVQQPSVLRPIQMTVDGKPSLDADGNEVPLRDSERDPEALYVDDVDLEDKMFIFQFVVGGTRDIETFRAESANMLGGVPTIQNVSLPAE